MLDILGDRQHALLKLLLKNKDGLAVAELAERLGITRNAVRQHIGALQNQGLLTAGTSRPSGGRPEQLYVLTASGHELFPRHYAWFAQLIAESLKQEAGSEAFQHRLAAMGAGVARQLLQQHPELETREQKVAKLAELMEQLGYDSAQVPAADAARVEAHNCIFHTLAMNDPGICRFDLALLESFTDSAVEHQECMATGGKVCRFRFAPKH